MSLQTNSEYQEFLSLCTDADKELLNTFFDDFSNHCLMSKKEKRLLRADFERAILFYTRSNTPLPIALQLLDAKNLGGFYARPSLLWFPLDNAAKVYPLSMGHGKMELFRLSVNLMDPVIPELLQMALNFTIKRFPSFATTLKKGFFWHYLDSSKRRFSIEPEHDIPCQPLQVSQSGSQTFRVLYYENRISMEFFHVLTDGFGGLTFLKVLVAEYIRLTRVEFDWDDSLWDIHATPEREEFENAFPKVPKSESASGFVDKPALQLSGRLSDCKPCRLLHFRMPSAQLKAAAQRHSGTITAYMLAVMFLGAKASLEEYAGEVSFQVPVNMRKFYPSRTVRNFSMYCGVRLDLDSITTLSDTIPLIARQLNEKASREVMQEMLTATVNLVNMLRYIPLAIKQPVAKAVYGFLGDKIFTSTLSNLGIVTLPAEVAAQIESMDFVLGASMTNRVSCSMITVNDVTTFSVTKMTADPTFEEKILELLQKDGISLTVEGSVLYGH